MALFNFNSEERKTRKMIQESEEKLLKLQEILDNDINNLLMQKNNIIFNIGQEVFLNKDKPLETVDLQKFYDEIQNLENNVNELNEKKNKLNKRYEEELSILYKTIEMPEGQPQQFAQNSNTCPQCGAAVPPDAAFCTNCGFNFANQQNQQPQPQGANTCPQCGAAVPPDAAFCTNCGCKF